MENADRTKHMCAIAAACLCVIFSKEMPIDSISKVQAQEAKESVLSEKYTDESTEIVRSETGRCIKEITVCDRLDAGHGGKDEGAVSDDGKLEEKRV